MPPAFNRALLSLLDETHVGSDLYPRPDRPLIGSPPEPSTNSSHAHTASQTGGPARSKRPTEMRRPCVTAARQRPLPAR